MTANPEPLTEEQRTLCLSCFPLALKIVGQFLARYPRIEREEMVGVASLSLVLAARGFDPTRGFRFTTFAHMAVTNGLKRLVRDTYTRRIPTVTIDAVDPPWPDDHEQPIDDALLAQVRDVAPGIVGPLGWSILIGRSQGRTLKAIGGDHGLTKEAIRQREQRATRMLRLALA